MTCMEINAYLLYLRNGIYRRHLSLLCTSDFRINISSEFQREAVGIYHIRYFFHWSHSLLTLLQVQRQAAAGQQNYMIPDLKGVSSMSVVLFRNIAQLHLQRTQVLRTSCGTDVPHIGSEYDC